ncbi:MAG: TIGR00282 family metallophosphoesterase [Schwartzia sp.]|nr:TIGR00282 family metallophosphoesterase [Schwartzia sp. (in: firmicutes)]
MNILMVGDVIGRPGRAAFARYTPKLRKEKGIDLVVVNGENAAGGKGLTEPVFDELLSGGADIVTSGNHIWDKKEVAAIIDREPYLVRPANYPEGTPGRGWCVYPWRAKNIGVLNLAGRTFMPPLDCPFQKAEAALRALKDCDVILVDFHAEATSEKLALGWYLDGRVSAVAGTHTHIQTADERVLPGGTAYVSDLGMVGPMNSVLGVRTDIILQKFTTGLPTRFDLADGPCVYSALFITIDEATGRTGSVERVQIREE